MSEPDSKLLVVNDVSVTYPDGTRALRGVSLAVPPGQRVALIGPNGSGKTSLLLAVMGAAKFTGRIVLDGIELSRRTTDAVRSRCGMVFENPDDQLFMPTLLDDVAFGPLNQGLPPAEAEHAARHAIEDVELAGLERRSAHHLSAGQKRSAAIATVLSMDVEVLLLDEPCNGLDPRSRRRLIDLLAARREAMLIASHDLDMVERLCARAVLLDGGRIAADGPAKAILGDAELLDRHGLR